MHRTLFAILASLSFQATANQIANKTIDRVHINLDSGIYFDTVEEFVNADNCTRTNQYRLSPNSAYEKEAYSLLISARISKSIISFYTSGCDTNGYPLVYWIRTHD